MACAAHVQIGPAHQCFWALHLRAPTDGPGTATELRERTHMLRRRGRVDVSEGRFRVHDAGVSLELDLEEEAGIEALCPHGAQQVWTRKQAGVRAQGTLALDGGAPAEVDALAVIDDTVGHHARETEWRWSAGAGTGADGALLAWNLVSGVNDPPSGSERAVWVDGSPHECSPVRFRDDLQVIRKEIPHSAECWHKNEARQGVDKDETPQRHLHRPGNEKGWGTQAGDKAGQKHRGVTMAYKEWPTALELMCKPGRKAW